MDMLTRALRSSTARSLFFLAMAAGSSFITYGSLGYFHPEDLHPFVVEKLPVAHEQLWLSALSVHVVTAALAFPACLLLLSLAFLRRAPRAHRWLGRVTGVGVLLALVPSGAVLAFEAKGGAWGTAGFLLSGAVLAIAMVVGVVHARARRYAAHRRAMAHVLAQMSVAVSSRVMLVGLDAIGMDAHAAYLASLWFPVLGSAAFVELLHASAWRAAPAFVPSSVHPLQGGNMRPVVSFVSLSLVFTMIAADARATEPAAPPAALSAPAAQAKELVEKNLVAALRTKERERSRFSRAAMPPAERRVQMTDAAAVKDKNGNAFLAFSIDERHGFFDADEGWDTASLTGCVYLKTGQIFVKRGDTYRPSAFLLGKKSKDAPAGVCEPEAGAAQASAPAEPANKSPART